MFPLALTLSTLSLLVLAAHFLRDGNLLACVVVLGLAGMLLFSRRRWVLRTSQFVLVLAAILWSFTTNSMVRERIAAGGPAARLGVILGAVIAVNVLAAVLLGTRPVQERFPAAPAPDAAGS